MRAPPPLILFFGGVSCCAALTAAVSSLPILAKPDQASQRRQARAQL
jgi:hypothetical protein